jgi:hypothetical protein
MAIGNEACARDLIKAAFENPAPFMDDHYESFRAASVPFECEHWTKMPAAYVASE